jgi:hypothetical protein
MNQRDANSGVTVGADYADDEIEFLKAIDRYKRANGRPFPGCSEILDVLKSLGYRKAEPAGPLPRFRRG